MQKYQIAPLALIYIVVTFDRIHNIFSFGPILTCKILRKQCKQLWVANIDLVCGNFPGKMILSVSSSYISLFFSKTENKYDLCTYWDSHTLSALHFV